MMEWEENLDRIPHHMRDGLKRYMLNGIDPGSFLYAVLCNDLKGAVGKADRTNQIYLREWGEYMNWYMPMAAQGSPEIVAKWIAHRGFSGLMERDNEAASE